MKKILLITLAVFALTSCKTREQQICENFLRPRMKCPSTFKVTEFSCRFVNDSVRHDTLLHIYKVSGKKTWDGTYPKRDTRYVLIDSIREDLIDIPAHRICVVSFDAQNLMGATVHDCEMVIIDQYDQPWDWSTWYSMHEKKAVSQPATAEKLKVSEFGMLAPYSFCVGDWIEQRRICKYGQSAQPIK